MFSKLDFELIDKSHFEVLQTTGYHIVLRSRDTRHFWDIYFVQTDGGGHISVNHKHKEHQMFHVQPNMHPKTVASAQELIKRHDCYAMKALRKQSQKPPRQCSPEK